MPCGKEDRIGVIFPNTQKYIAPKIDKESAKKVQKKIDEIENWERETGRDYLYELYTGIIKIIREDQKKEGVCHVEKESKLEWKR
jgi:hypothetical protein